VLVGGALGYGMLHFVYLGYTYVGMLGLVAAPFAHGFFVSYVIARAKASGSLGITGAVMTSSGSLTLLLFVIWGEGVFCIITAAPIWLAFSVVGMLLGKRLARHLNRTALAIGIIPLSVIGAHHLDNVVIPPERLVVTSMEVSAKASEIWPFLFQLDGLGEPGTWYFRAGAACPTGTSTDFETKTRLCHLTTGDLIERIEVMREDREVRWKVLRTPDSVKEWNPFNSKKPAFHDGWRERG